MCRPVSALAVSTFGRSRSFSATRPRMWSRSASSPRDVPLVEHERRRARGLHRQLGDPQVLGGDAVGRVAHDERDVGPLGRALRAQRRVVLDRVAHLALAPHAGGVDERHPAVAHDERHVDRVARRAGHVGDDHAVLAQEAVDERGLADVRPPDDGEPHDVLVGLVVVLGQERHERVEQIAAAEPLGGRHRDRLAEPESVELGGERHVAHRVDLVGGDEHRDARAAQQVGKLLVAGAHAGLRVDDEQRDGRVGDPGAGLIADRAGQWVDVLEVDAAGVDEREAAPVPLAGKLLAIARDAGAFVHDRLTRAREAVDERGLAHVRIADDGDLHGSQYGGPGAGSPGPPRRPCAGGRGGLRRAALPSDPCELGRAGRLGHGRAPREPQGRVLDPAPCAGS